MKIEYSPMHPALNSPDYPDELYWSHVGPAHERCSFGLLYLLDCHSINSNGAPPFKVSTGFGFKKPIFCPPKATATMPAAKRAARAWFLKWLGTAGYTPIEWVPHENGVHMHALADGLEIGLIYNNPPPKRDHWHVGFVARFGMTYFRSQVSTVDQAKEAMAKTWEEWLIRARKKFLGVGFDDYAGVGRDECERRDCEAERARGISQ